MTVPAASYPPSPFYSADDIRLLEQFRVVDRKPRPGFIVDFLDVHTRITSLAHGQRASEGVLDLPVPGDYHAETIEYVGLLKSVVRARDEFVALELGAGWGPWLVAGAKAARARGIEPVRLYGIEADPVHVEFMRQHLRDNDLDPDAHRLIHAAVGLEAGRARFPRVADAANDWGSRPARLASGEAHQEDVRYLGSLLDESLEVDVLALPDVLAQEPRWDLVHIDIQGWEAFVCEGAFPHLEARVATLVIGTHSRKIEGDLMALFHRGGWVLENEQPSRFRYLPGVPLLESMNLADGTQVWTNPRLA